MQPEVEVSAIGKRGDDLPSGSEVGSQLLQKVLRAPEMFEDIADHDHVKRAGQSRERFFEIMNDSGRILVEAERVFDACHGESFVGKKL